jgi:hypothetical protein
MIQIPATERNAIFPFMVQRKNPATGRWLNVSAQPKESDALIVKAGIEGCGFESRVVCKK